MNYTEINQEGATLYKLDSTGKTRIWKVEIGETKLNEEGLTNAATRVISGVEGGKMVVSKWKEALPKNIGKANETIPYEQAVLEARSKWTKQKDKGYGETVEAAKAHDKVKPMLASTYKILNFAKTKSVYSQPKLDGIRCIARKDGMWTRAGKLITSCPHIMEALNPIFEPNPEFVFDGELYNHELKEDFNRITSIVRKEKATDSDLKRAKDLIQYHIYDTVVDDDFEARLDFLKHFLKDMPDCIQLVNTTLVRDSEHLESLCDGYLSNGYEGQMIRVDDEGYQTDKRPKTLQKRKNFITEEYKVISVEEGQGNWAGCAKRFTLVDQNGVNFGAGIRGTQEQMEALLQQDKPDWATVRYFNLTPDGVPRFGVVVDYGYGERDD